MTAKLDLPCHHGAPRALQPCPRRKAAPWELGHAQPAVVALWHAGAFGPSVLEVGCGRGGNVLFLAERGVEAWGIDLDPGAVAHARVDAHLRGIDATFLEGDALDLAALDYTFDTILDCGLLGELDEADRPLYAASLAVALRPGGRVHLLCVSEREPGQLGPRRVRSEEIQALFARGWHVEALRPAMLELHSAAGGAQAWQATVIRTQ